MLLVLRLCLSRYDSSAPRPPNSPAKAHTGPITWCAYREDIHTWRPAVSRPIIWSHGCNQAPDGNDIVGPGEQGGIRINVSSLLNPAEVAITAWKSLANLLIRGCNSSLRITSSNLLLSLTDPENFLPSFLLFVLLSILESKSSMIIFDSASIKESTLDSLLKIIELLFLVNSKNSRRLSAFRMSQTAR